MKRRFSDEQIIGMIKEYEAGVKPMFGSGPHFYTGKTINAKFAFSFQQREPRTQ